MKKHCRESFFVVLNTIYSTHGGNQHQSIRPRPLIFWIWFSRTYTRPRGVPVMTRKLSVGSFRSSGGQNFRARRTYGGENRFSKDFDSDLFIYFLILMEGRRPVRHRTNRRGRQLKESNLCKQKSTGSNGGIQSGDCDSLTKVSPKTHKSTGNNGSTQSGNGLNPVFWSISRSLEGTFGLWHFLPGKNRGYFRKYGRKTSMCSISVLSGIFFQFLFCKK